MVIPPSPPILLVSVTSQASMPSAQAAFQLLCIQDVVIPVSAQEPCIPTCEFGQDGLSGGRSLQAKYGARKIQGFLNGPDPVVVLWRENLGRVAHGDPRNWHRGVRRKNLLR